MVSFIAKVLKHIYILSQKITIEEFKGSSTFKVI